MAKQTNIWVYVIIALIVGILIGYATAGGFAKAGQAVKRGGGAMACSCYSTAGVACGSLGEDECNANAPSCEWRCSDNPA